MAAATMTERFHRPARVPGEMFEAFAGAADPAETSSIAHETAKVRRHRARGTDDAAVIGRLVDYTAANGVDDIAELWSCADPGSLPGALWRLYLIREAVRHDPEGLSTLDRRGAEIDRSILIVVAGAAEPVDPDAVLHLTGLILRGAFRGDFALALDRAAAFAAVVSQGAAVISIEVEEAREEPAAATDEDGDDAARASEAFLRLSDELRACARLQRAENLG